MEMTPLYICPKCGMVFTRFEDAIACKSRDASREYIELSSTKNIEIHHPVPEEKQRFWYKVLTGIGKLLMKWKEGNHG